MRELAKTKKTTLRRSPTRAVFDRAMLYKIFDEAHIAHVGFSIDDQSYVVPMLCWRVGNRLYIHGSNGSRMIKALTGDVSCCVTATLLDGMVLAKSAFHHSSNYRSAMVFGQFSLVADEQELEASLKQFMENIAPGRWSEVRASSENELKATTVLAIDIEEASVKVREGGPNDDVDDLDLPVWSGVMVMQQVVTSMQADAIRSDGVVSPDYSKPWAERWKA